MNLNNIKEIVDSNLPNNIKEKLIIVELSKDSQVIPKVMEILNVEREANKSLITDANVQISRFVAQAQSPRLVEKEFLIEQAKKFYDKYEQIQPCYNLEGFPGYQPVNK